MESESNDSLYDPEIIHFEEERLLLKESERKFMEKIKEINENDVKEIFEGEKMEKEFSENQILMVKELEEKKLFWIIIILSICLFTFHLISAFQINGIIFAIQEELIASIKSYFQKKDRGLKDDFYQNFNKLNCIFPDYSMFYISSILSENLSHCVGYISLNIFVLFINFITLFFGFKEYKFNLERNKYKNYSLDEFLFLYILYLVLCICQGFIILLPLNIIKKGFKFYESFKKVTKVRDQVCKDKDSLYKRQDKSNNSEININEENNNIEDKKDKKEIILYVDPKTLNLIKKLKNKDTNNIKDIDHVRNLKRNKNIIFFEGYFLFFLISLILSVLIKTFLDQQFIREYNYNSRKRVNYYFIINYCIFTCVSLIFYIIYKNFFFKDEKKKNKINKSSFELFGYVIYNKSIEAEDISCCECCEDCKICCQTLNLSLCCYLCSCKCCCKAICCCECCKDNLFQNNRYRIRKVKDMNKIETICIFYRVTGKCNWFGKILTDTKIYYLVALLYFSLIINMGFEDRFWSNIENNTGGGKNIYLINGITLIYILILYLLNHFIWKFVEKSLYKEKEKKKENEVGIDIFSFKEANFYFTFQPLISLIISALVYFREINKIENYFLSIAIGSVIYIKIYVLEFISFYFEQNYKSLSLLSSSTIISLYLFIWDIIFFILDIADADNNKIILAQFIICCCFVALFFICFLNQIREFNFSKISNRKK